MKILPVKNTVIIGAGNVAWHLGIALSRSGIAVQQVVNRSELRGRRLAKKVGAEYISSLKKIASGSDLYILAVSDDAIGEIASDFPYRNALLVHTSGSVPIDVLSGATERPGVFYPLQTFKTGGKVSFRTIPVCPEARLPEDLRLLTALASSLSDKVFPMSSEQRKILHLTAVFAGNFSNFLYTIAEDLLEKHHIPFELLKPLIFQTARNASHEDLFSRQTGPAVREDWKVMEQHRELLARYAAYSEIYELISRSIIQYKKGNGKL